MLFICCATLLSVPIGLVWGLYVIVSERVEERRFMERYGIR